MTDEYHGDEHALGPRQVHWAGRQWCVTDYGLETIEPDAYSVGAGQLTGLTQGIDEPMAERMRHITEKTWVDVEDFAAAFAVALAVHSGKSAELPPQAFLAALREARAGKMENEIWNELKRERGISSLDMGSGGDLMIESDRRMRERYPDRSVFEAIHDPAPKPVRSESEGW